MQNECDLSGRGIKNKKKSERGDAQIYKTSIDEDVISITLKGHFNPNGLKVRKKNM